jgi:hypothetical protein
VIKSRRLRWTGHVARIGDGRGVYRVLVGGQKGIDRWEDLGIGGRITLRWILGVYKWMDGANWIRLDQNRVRWRAFINTVINLPVP